MKRCIAEISLSSDSDTNDDKYEARRIKAINRIKESFSAKDTHIIPITMVQSVPLAGQIQWLVPDTASLSSCVPYKASLSSCVPSSTDIVPHRVTITVVDNKLQFACDCISHGKDITTSCRHITGAVGQLVNKYAHTSAEAIGRIQAVQELSDAIAGFWF